MFSYGPLYMGMPVLADPQNLQQLCMDPGYRLEDLPEVMDDRAKWWERGLDNDDK